MNILVQNSRRLFISLLATIIIILPTVANAESPYYTQKSYQANNKTDSYHWASFILDWKLFESIFLTPKTYTTLFTKTEVVPATETAPEKTITITSVVESDPYFYPKTDITDVSHGWAPKGDPIISTNATNPTQLCSMGCAGTNGSVGYAPGDIGYNDGVKVITKDYSTGRIYETYNFDKVNSSWVSMGCDASPTAGCFIK
jgi:hypothetical protein